MTELEPCPFCGEPPDHVMRAATKAWEGHKIGCSCCGAASREYDTALAATSAWNRVARAVALNAELVGVLEMVMQHGRIDNSESRMNQVAAVISKAKGES